MTMKRLWRKLEFSQWDNDCGTANALGEKLYFYKNRPITFEQYRDKLMIYFKDFDEDY